MTIFRDIRQLGTPARTALPAPQGFAAQVAAEFETVRRTNNIRSFEFLERQTFEQIVGEIEAETGERLPSPFSAAAFDETNAFFREGGLERRLRVGTTGSFEIGQLKERKSKEFFDARIAALREKHPNAASLKTTAQVQEAAKRRAQNLEARSAELDPLPALIGGLAGSATDPIGLILAPFGGFTAKTALGAIVKGAALNAGAEAAIQPGVQAARERLGLPHGFKEGLTNVAFAAGAGGLLGGGGHGLARLLDVFKRAPDPEVRAGAAEIEREIEVKAEAEAAAGDRLAPAEAAAHQRRLNAASRVLEDEIPDPADLKALRGEGEPVKFAAVRRDIAVTAGGREINIEYGIVELNDLIASHTRNFARNPAFPADLQPRDRSRAASAAQVARIAADLNPRLLDDAADAGAGAPIVAQDGVVESGNGRVIALAKVYEAGGTRATAYRDYLGSRNYPVENFAEPVLVRKRLDDLDQPEREAFAREANARSTAAMSAGEQARSDAKAIKAEDFGLLADGDLATAKNAPFVRQMVARIAPEAERGALMDRAGRLSPEGKRRIDNAVFAFAYDDEALVARLLDGGDELKSLGLALSDAAPEWGRLRADVEAGAVDARVDMRPFLVEAANLVAEARRTGRNVAEFVGQTDIFTGALDPRTVAFLSGMFRNPDFTGVKARATIAEELTFYAKEARKAASGPGLFGDAEDPGGRILAALRQRAGREAQPDPPGLFDPGEDGRPPSLLSEAEGRGGGAEAAGGRDVEAGLGTRDSGLEAFDEPASPAAARAVAAKESEIEDDLAGLADDAELVTGVDVAGNELVARVQTKAQLEAEFKADEALLKRVKRCVP